MSFLLFPFTLYCEDGKFYSLVKEELMKKLDYSVSDIKLSFSLSTKIKVFFEGKYNINHLSISNIYNNSFQVVINYNNSLKDILLGYYKAFVEIPVLKENLKKGHIISQEDLRLMTIDYNRVHNNMVTQENEIIGMELKNNLLSNKILKKRDFLKPTILEKGQLVSTEYKTNKIYLKTNLMALQNGGVNDIIDCMPLSKNKVIKKCKIINSKLVNII